MHFFNLFQKKNSSLTLIWGLLRSLNERFANWQLPNIMIDLDHFSVLFHRFVYIRLVDLFPDPIAVWSFFQFFFFFAFTRHPFSLSKFAKIHTYSYLLEFFKFAHSFLNSHCSYWTKYIYITWPIKNFFPIFVLINFFFGPSFFRSIFISGRSFHHAFCAFFLWMKREIFWSFLMFVAKSRDEFISHKVNKWTCGAQLRASIEGRSQKPTKSYPKYATGTAVFDLNKYTAFVE